MRRPRTLAGNIEPACPFVRHTGPLSVADKARCRRVLSKEGQMSSVFYIIGVVVVVIAVLNLAGVV
ncbi:hypothetical protein [Azospirillum sp. ST 5-10]|uniref:hypothetical protein n=1 Tax=Azospirillum sp. ST 5-10 TaxID=3445776 RepID=UPI003F4A59FE